MVSLYHLNASFPAPIVAWSSEKDGLNQFVATHLLLRAAAGEFPESFDLHLRLGQVEKLSGLCG
jgi:hypothetical protein